MFGYKYMVLLVVLLLAADNFAGSAKVGQHDYEDFYTSDDELTPENVAKALGEDRPDEYYFDGDVYSIDSESDGEDAVSLVSTPSSSDFKADTDLSLIDPLIFDRLNTPENNPDLYNKFLLQNALLTKRSLDDLLVDRLVNLEIRRKMQDWDEIAKVYTDISQARLAATKKLKSKRPLEIWEQLALESN